MKTTPTQPATGIRDNHGRGTVADFLKAHVKDDSHLSFVSSYFTIYAYEGLKANLDQVRQFDFLFGDPRSVHTLDPDKTATKAFYIGDDGLELKNKLEQKRVARGYPSLRHA